MKKLSKKVNNPAGYISIWRGNSQVAYYLHAYNADRDITVERGYLYYSMRDAIKEIRALAMLTGRAVDIVDYR